MIDVEQVARELARHIAEFLQQEYRWHNGAYWLFTLGEPARPLTEEEIVYHQERGELPAVESGENGD